MDRNGRSVQREGTQPHASELRSLHHAPSGCKALEGLFRDAKLKRGFPLRAGASDFSRCPTSAAAIALVCCLPSLCRIRALTPGDPDARAVRDVPQYHRLVLTENPALVNLS